jgi:ribosomal protein S18 acetylase RimI-like enzyme
VYVDELHRRHGIAHELLALVETLARDAGIGTLRLVVHESNAGAVGLYEGLGYVAGHGMMEKRI